MESQKMDQNSRKGIVFGYRTVDLPTSSSRLETRSEEMKGLRLDPIGPRKDTRYVDEDDHSSNRRVNDWVRQYNLHERSDLENLNIEKDFGYSKFSGQPRIAGDQGRLPYYAYPNEAPSGKASGPLYGYGEKMWNNSVPNKPNSEQDPVEIMRTLDELKDQLNRYCGAMDKPRVNNERAFPDRYYENIQVSRPIDREKVYLPRHDLAASEDQFHAQMNRKPHGQSLPREYDLGRRMDINQFSHHSACTCFQCVPTRHPQSSFDRVNPKDFLSANLNQIGSPLNLGPHNSSPHGSDYTPSRDARSRERWTSDPESDGDSLTGPRRLVIRRKNEQYCRSIAGGAPFIACYNCFELLKLPRNLMKGKNKLQCGACSSIIDVQIEKKRVIIGSSKESKVSSELVTDLHGLKAPKNVSGDFSDSGGKSDYNLKNSGQKSTLEDQELKLSSSEKKLSDRLSSANKFDRNLKYSDHKSALEDQELKLSLSEKMQSVSSSLSNKSDLNLKKSEQKPTLEDEQLQLSLSEKKQSVSSDYNLKYSDHKSTLEDQELKLSSSEKKQSDRLSSADKFDRNLKYSDHKSALEDQELKLSLSEKMRSVNSSSSNKSDPNLKKSEQKPALEDEQLKLSLSEKKQSVSSDYNLKYSDHKSTLEDQELKLSSSEKKQSDRLSSADKFDWNLKYSDHKSALEDQELKLSLSEKMQSVNSSWSYKSDPNLKKSEQKSTLEDEQLKLSLSEKKQSVSSDYNLKNSDQKSTLEDQELKLSLSEKKQSISSSSSDQNLKNSDHKLTVEARELKLNLSEKRLSVSSSSGFSEGEESPSPLIMLESTSNTAKPSSSPTKNALLFDELSNHSNSDINIHGKVHSSQNYMEDVSESTESEDSLDEYPNTQTSQDSIEAFKEDQNKNDNGEGIYLADSVKNRHVFVNGHPIPDDLVKKAQKLAGSVLPGDYWYDYRAGFWGVMGNPCLGIVPPFIEEFNYPMPTNCAAGNTGVYVNGRQLHKNDLDLLAGRGLPTISDRFYIIDISGKVVDEDSGEELYYLGKLAPTIEKMKRGFGMKVPHPNV